MRTLTLNFVHSQEASLGASSLPFPTARPHRSARPRALTDVIILPGLALVLGYAAVAQGGFYPAQASLVAGIALALALAAAVSRPSLLVDGTMGFGLLLTGLIASAVATGWPAQTLLPAAALGSAFGAFLAGRRLVQQGDRDALARLLAWVGAGVGLLGLVGLAFHRVP